MSHQSVTAKDIADEARRLGFDLVGIAPAGPSTTIDRYRSWLQSGFHGEMAYLARRDAVAKRADPSLIQPSLRSVVAVGVNYHTAPLPAELRDDPSRGVIASYAWGDDYHDWMVSRLRLLAASVQGAGREPLACRAYADTGPLLERELAVRAGLGFAGKNTNLIHPQLGSWLLLGELLLAVQLPAERSVPVQETCGSCTRCLDVCPTGALVAPHVLDARRCISYLTIELKGAIPRELRPFVGNRIFGCDICQEVCPWNRRFARPTVDPAFQPRPGTIAPPLLELLALDNNKFRHRFRNSPIERARRRGLLRNVVVALGNWGHRSAVEPLITALYDDEPLLRGHAAWALGQIPCPSSQAALAQALAAESDPWVQQEIRWSL
jgi:epoxyqueuosine reductase